MRWVWEKPSRLSPSSHTSWSTSGSMDPTSLLYPFRELNSFIWAVIYTKTQEVKRKGFRITQNELLKNKLSLIDRTLSNWVYEFDKWAPTVVKVSYKVSFCCYTIQIFFLTLYLTVFWGFFAFRGLLLPEEPLFPNCAVESLTFYSPLMSTSSRTNKYWPRWDFVYRRRQKDTQKHTQANILFFLMIIWFCSRFSVCLCFSAPTPSTPI